MNEPNPNLTSGGSASAEQSIMVIIEHRPEIVLLDDKRRDQLFAHIEAEVEAFVPDMATAKSRDECRALAAKVTKTKTAVDKARLQLTEDARTKIKSINESGGIIKEKLEALATTARAPLTAWEEADDARQEKCKGILNELRALAVIPMGATSEAIRERIREVEAEDMSEELWQGMLELATPARDTALEALKAALALVEQKERDEAELAALRAEAAANAAREEKEREDRDRAAREAREAQEREAALDRAEEAARASAEERRLAEEQAATAAAATARAEEAARAADEAAEQQRAHDEELAAAEARAAEAERTAQAEREAREAADREKARQEQAEKDAREQLERDQARRTLVKREAKEALITTGMSEDHAKAAVLLIIAGEVPRVLLDFAAEPKVRPASPEPEERTLV